MAINYLYTVKIPKLNKLNHALSQSNRHLRNHHRCELLIERHSDEDGFGAVLFN